MLLYVKEPHLKNIYASVLCKAFERDEPEGRENRKDVIA